MIFPCVPSPKTPPAFLADVVVSRPCRAFIAVALLEAEDAGLPPQILGTDLA